MCCDVVNPSMKLIVSDGRCSWARVSGRPQLTVHLGSRPVGLRRSGHVLAPGLLARCVAVVPISVEQNTSMQRNHTSPGLARTQPFSPIHPVGVFAQQLRQILLGALPAAGFAQPDHEREHRRL